MPASRFQLQMNNLRSGLNRLWHWLTTVAWVWLRDHGRRVWSWLRPRFWRTLGGGIVIFGLLVALFTAYVYVSYLWQSDDISARLDHEKEWLHGRGANPARPPIKIYDRNRKLIGEYLPVRGSHITSQVCQQMQWLPRAAVAAEDRYFYDHSGIAWQGIVRAMLNNITSLSMREGGGTITQQLARNLFTDRARTLYRKLYESFVARLIESRFTKAEILCLYLNKIYMGEGRIGAEEASWFYFRKPPQNLSAAEAAMIVGLFPSPVRYSPLNNIELSLQKQKAVLAAMLRDGQIKKGQELILQQRFIRQYAVQANSTADPGEIGRYGASRDFRFNIAPAANAYVKEYLYENLPEEQIQAGGLQVFTTIDKDRQVQALQAVRSTVRQLRSEMIAKSKAPPEKLARLARRINGVLVSINPQTAEILALVGGYAISEGNMTQRPFRMLRQPGSSMKGFLYAVAMDEDVLDVNSLVEDKRFRQGKWSPRNWNGQYLGPIPVRKALAISSNSAAVRTLDQLGSGVFRRRMLSAIEAESGDRIANNLTLALGTAELTPMELARIYALVNNGGLVVAPYLVNSIKDAEGSYLMAPSDELRVGPELLSREACDKAVKLMTYVLDPEIGGTAGHIGKERQRNPKYLPFDVAGKTGTVQVDAAVRKKFPGIYGSQKDAWFVGLVPGETTVVWLGQDEGAPISRGGVTAAEVWARYSQAALPGKVQGHFATVEIIDPDPVPDKTEECSPFDLFCDPSDKSAPVEKGKGDNPDQPQSKNPQPDLDAHPQDPAADTNDTNQLPVTTDPGQATLD
ncbi:MAG: transglycosylase domain-containing protein [Leptospiraceae bacterium]|nr:transglycosylase domain-containing protein [Leptospiraceae bacterium]